MRNRSLEDARSTSRIFRNIVGTLLGCCIPAAVMCGGTVTGMDGGMEPDGNGNVDGGGPKCVPPDAAGRTCFSTYTVDNCQAYMDGFPDCFNICGGPASCQASGTSFTCTVLCAVDGRRPPGWLEEEEGAHGCDTLDEHFARTAFFERASADAFEVLAGELRAHGAPKSLIRSARHAKRDELDHARRARRLAGVRQTVRKRTTNVRSLVDIALDNAREGCARETFGALLGWAQAMRATDPSVRGFYATIARDETRHATFSWRLHAWLLGRLDERDRERVRHALEEALEGVQAQHSSIDDALGIPDEGSCRALASALRRMA